MRFVNAFDSLIREINPEICRKKTEGKSLPTEKGRIRSVMKFSA